MLLSIYSYGQHSGRESISTQFLHDASQALSGSAHVISGPLRWESDDWLNFGTIAGITFITYFLDRPIRNMMQNQNSAFNDRISRIGEIYGEPLTVVVLTAGMYSYGLFLKNTDMRKAAVLMTASLLPGGAVQTVAKITAGRARPLTGEGHNIFRPFSRIEDYYSFVSGHTLVAMSISQVLAKQVQYLPLKIGIYSLGVIGGLSRLYKNDHWFSDIILGTILSYVCVNTADHWLNNDKKNISSTGIRTLFHASSKQVTISFVW